MRYSTHKNSLFTPNLYMSRSLSLAGSKAMQVNSMIVLHKSIILLRFYLLFWECHGLAELEFD